MTNPPAVGGPGTVPTFTPPPSTSETDNVQGRQITGSGVNAPSGTVPNTPNDPSYSALMESLSKLMPNLSTDQLDVLRLEITTKMKEVAEAAQKDKIQVDQEAKRTALADKIEKLEEAVKKINEAIEKEKNASIWDKIKMAFQALGALLAIAVGAILIATGVGAAAGVALIAIGVLSLIMFADSLTKELNDGLGIAGSIAKASGEDDPEKLAKADMGFGIALAAVALIAAVVMFFIPGGQAAAVQSFAQSVATISQSVANIATATIAVATAVGDTATGVIRYEAAKEQAEAKKTQAEAKEMEAFIQQLDAFIDQALSSLLGNNDRFNEIIDGIIDAVQDRQSSLMRAKFG